MDAIDLIEEYVLLFPKLVLQLSKAVLMERLLLCGIDCKSAINAEQYFYST